MIRRFGASLLAVVVFASLVSMMAHAQSQALLTGHTRDVTVNGQAPLVGYLPAHQTMQLVFVLQHRNQAGLDNFLKEVYDPSSTSYRKFLTVEQFTEAYGPSREDYEELKDFARANGFKIFATSRNRMILQVSDAVEQVEKALHVRMGVYQHDTEERTFFAPDREPTIDLPFQLWHVGGLDNYSTPKPMFRKRDVTAEAEATRSNATIGSGPSDSFLGSDMRAAYYTSTGGTLDGSGQSLGLFELLGTDLQDLDTYYANVNQTLNVPITLKSVDTQSTSCTDNSAGGLCDDTEQTLDMTQALGMAPNLASLVMYIGTGGKSGQTIDDAGILNAMATADPLNNQLSCSWAWKPTDNTTDDPFFQEFQAQGQDFFAAAGDDGNWAHAEFVWPADDPYITSVGGTDLDTSSAGGPWASETGWVDGGGGISPNKFAIPSWQTAAAAGCAKCSQTYRNGPDVSANANFTFYVCADQTKCTANLYGGTSFAAPMWAGLLALANQQAASNGNSAIGFINPAIYNIYESSSYPSDFHDITSGGNSLGCAVGYDLSCGIGTPIGEALVDSLAGTQTAGFSLSANPNSVSVTQGTSGTSTITSTTTGSFNGAITLTASGQPSGVTVSFSPTSITGAGTSTMTMAVGSSVAPGTYTITVTGTSGSITETTTATLTVTAAGSFSLKASPGSITIAPGSSGKVKVTSTVSGGFNAAVSFKASGAGTGVHVTVSPSSLAAPGSGSVAVQIKVASTAKSGTQTITITGSGGGQAHTTTITLTIS